MIARFIVISVLLVNQKSLKVQDGKENIDTKIMLLVLIWDAQAASLYQSLSKRQKKSNQA